MKSLLLLFFICSASFAQCPISFEKLYKSVDFSFSEFETFAMLHGYIYNATQKDFRCTTGKDTDVFLLKYDPKESSYDHSVVANAFHDKTIYIEYKSILDKEAEYLYYTNENDMLIQNYNYNGYRIKLKTQTFGRTNLYSIVIVSK